MHLSLLALIHSDSDSIINAVYPTVDPEQDPLNCMNNVGRSSYCISQVQRVFFEALTTLKAAMVRVNQDGKEVSKPFGCSIGEGEN